MKRILLLMAMGMILLWACSNDNDVFEEDSSVPVVAGTYSADLVLSTEKGSTPEVSTRGLDSVNGQFTDVYPYDYIYIHSADSKSDEEGHRCLRIPLKDVVFCDGCQGIHLEMEVLDEESGGGYVIKNSEGESITLAANEEVYFSTIDSAYWKADVTGATPVSGSDVFIQDNDINKELLRSQLDYSKEELVSLLGEPAPSIPMERHCTAFRVYFMFTDVFASNMGTIDAAQWNEYFGEDYTNFYVKLYLGPNFTEEYNVYNDEVTDPAGKGFYVTNEQEYRPFMYAEYGTTSGTGGMIAFTGFGYMTELGNYLIAPLNTHLPADSFSVYVFVKHTDNIAAEPDDFLTSDAGAKWFRLQVPSMTLETNRVHYVVMSVDYRNLDIFKEEEQPVAARLTRSPWQAPMRMELKHPYKVIDVPGE